MKNLCPFMDDILNALDGLEVDGVLEVDQALLLIEVGLFDEFVDLADHVVLQLAGLPRDLVPDSFLLQLQLVDQLSDWQAFLDYLKIDAVLEIVDDLCAALVFSLHCVEQPSLVICAIFLVVPLDLRWFLFLNRVKFYLITSKLIKEYDGLLLDHFKRVLFIILQIDLFLEKLIHHSDVINKRKGDIQLWDSLKIVGNEEIDVSKELFVQLLLQVQETSRLVIGSPLISRNYSFELNNLITEEPTSHNADFGHKTNVFLCSPLSLILSPFVPHLSIEQQDSLESTDGMRSAGSAGICLN